MSASPRPPIPSLIPESAPFTPEQRTWLNGLFAGLFGLVRGGGDPARSNQLMRWRVILQGAALLLFALLMTLLRS